VAAAEGEGRAAALTRYLVTGAGGQLGAELVRLLADRAADHIPLRHADLDITDAPRVADALRDLRPDVVINAAAYTAVDAAETDEPRALAVNAGGPAALAAACAAGGARLLHLSTDYVFAGTALQPYPEAASPAPNSAYGRTKAAGERAVLGSPARAWVVRTGWLYGASGGNFVKTMACLERTQATVSVVDDQHGSPTWAADLAAGLVELIEKDPPPGIYHATGGGATTWCGLARAVFEELGADPERVRPVGTAEAPRPAPRPAYSVLAADRWRAAGLAPLRAWRDALAAAFARDGTALRAG
jgi:dTDP-4-dehydrorhamnose reductase